MNESNRLLQDWFHEERAVDWRALESVPDAMCAVTPDWRIERMNQRFRDLFGYDQDELTGRSLDEITHPEDRYLDARQFKSLVVKEIESYDVVKRFLRKDGGIVSARISVSLCRSPNSVKRYMICSLSENHEQKAATGFGFTSKEGGMSNGFCQNTLDPAWDHAGSGRAAAGDVGVHLSGGRFLEPDAKKVLQVYGLDVPRFMWAKTEDQAVHFAGFIGYPVVSKVVSPAIYCKSDRNGVETKIDDDGELRAAFQRFSRMPRFMGMLVEERFANGPAIKVGVTRIDYRLGPAIFLEPCDGDSHASGCGSRQLPGQGQYRIRAALNELGLLRGVRENDDRRIDEAEFERMLSNVARIVADPDAGVEAVILDPVRCTPNRCIVLDVRMKLARQAPLARPGHAAQVGWRMPVLNKTA